MALDVEHPQIDAFASPKNARCSLFWDRKNSAFTRSWKAQGLLWINPPFTRLEEVVNKVEKDQATCLFLCPNWPTAPWWEKLQGMAQKMFYYPRGTLLFENEDGQTQAPTHWGVWIFYINPNAAETKTVRVLTGCRETSLRIPVRLFAGEDEVTPLCPALIDTGAEICVLQRGLIPEKYLRPTEIPLRLVGANERRLEGGDQVATLNLCVGATLSENNKKVELRVPTTFYIADIKDSLILSYEWCRQRGFDISPRKHGLWCSRKGEQYWVEGISSQDSPISSTVVNQFGSNSEPLRALDLFSGTGSATKVLKEAGFSVFSVDNDPLMNPTLCVDILDWDFKQFPPGHFALITASPPCTEFSRAKTVGSRDLDTACKIVQKTLDIVQYFQPQKWWLETPRFGLLPKQPFMSNFPFWDVDYRQFGLQGSTNKPGSTAANISKIWFRPCVTGSTVKT